MSPQIESHKVELVTNKTRLSDYCIGVFQLIPTRKGIKKAIQRGQVLINDKLGSTGDFVKSGDVITLSIQEEISQRHKMPIGLIVHYEDDFLAIVEKPAGVVVSGNKKYTLESMLPALLTCNASEDTLIKPQAIHRLDYPTSGLLIVGKTYSAVRQLNRLFEQRAIAKTYHAVVIGDIKESGEIANAIDGKSALTLFSRISQLESSKYGYLSLVRINLHTGRKHQIRKHMYAMGHPVLGDKLYCIKDKVSYGNGLYLHASNIEFRHPQTNKQVKVASSLPAKFNRLFGSIE